MMESLIFGLLIIAALVGFIYSLDKFAKNAVSFGRTGFTFRHGAENRIWRMVTALIVAVFCISFAYEVTDRFPT